MPRFTEDVPMGSTVEYFGQWELDGVRNELCAYYHETHTEVVLFNSDDDQTGAIFPISSALAANGNNAIGYAGSVSYGQDDRVHRGMVKSAMKLSRIVRDELNSFVDSRGGKTPGVMTPGVKPVKYDLPIEAKAEVKH